MGSVERRLLERGYIALDELFTGEIDEAAALATPGIPIDRDRDDPGYRSLRMHFPDAPLADPGAAALHALVDGVARRCFGRPLHRSLQLTETWFCVRPGKLRLGPHIDGTGPILRPVTAVMIVLLTPHDGRSGLYVVPGSVPALAEALSRPFRAAPPDHASFRAAVDRRVDEVGLALGNFEFLSGPAGRVFLLHALAAHGVMHPPDGDRQRRAVLRLYSPGLDFDDQAACLERARRLDYPFGEWRQAIARLEAEGYR